MKIEEMGLPVRAENAIKRANIPTVEILVERMETESDLPRMVGESALVAVRKWLDSGRTAEGYQQAKGLHECIVYHGRMAQTHLVDMCRSLKEMHDSKLYKQLGYATFEDYCETELNISRKHAYKYLAIINKLPLDFVSTSRQIGMEKLYLLTTLTALEQETVIQTTDLESTTVKALKAQIADIRKQAEHDKARAEQEAERLQTESITARQKVIQLEAQVRELESRPIESTYAPVSESAEMEKMRAAMDSISKDAARRIKEAEETAIQQKRSLLQEIQALKAAQTPQQDQGISLISLTNILEDVMDLLDEVATGKNDIADVRCILRQHPKFLPERR